MLGIHLIAELAGAGCRDLVLAVHSARRVETVRDGLRRLGIDPGAVRFTVVEADLTCPGSLDGRMPCVGTLFNCAARIMSGSMTADGLVEHNTAIARNVSRWALAAGVGRMVHVSSISALAMPAGGEGTVDENDVPDNVDGYAAYGRSKFYSEREVWAAAAEGLPVTVVMPSVILGENDSSVGNNSSALIPAVSCGQPFFTDGLMGYVDVRDVARAMVMLAGRNDTAGRRYILSAGDLSYRELMTIASHAARRPAPFIRIGRGAVNAAYALMRAGIALHLVRDRGVTRENLGSVLRRIRYDGTAIARDTGFVYTPIEKTVCRVTTACRSGRRRSGGK